MVFTAHVSVFPWPSWHNFGDIVQNFVFAANFHPPNKSLNFKTVA